MSKRSEEYQSFCEANGIEVPEGWKESPKRQIKVYLTGALAMTQHVRFFSDWFSFADWLKQEALAGRCAIIYNWEYVEGEDWRWGGG